METLYDTQRVMELQLRLPVPDCCINSYHWRSMQYIFVNIILFTNQFRYFMLKGTFEVSTFWEGANIEFGSLSSVGYSGEMYLKFYIGRFMRVITPHRELQRLGNWFQLIVCRNKLTDFCIICFMPPLFRSSPWGIILQTLVFWQQGRDDSIFRNLILYVKPQVIIEGSQIM
jgi:hypothetical protein